MVVVVINLVCIIMCRFYFPVSHSRNVLSAKVIEWNVLPAKANDPIIIRNSMILGSGKVSGDP